MSETFCSDSVYNRVTPLPYLGPLFHAYFSSQSTYHRLLCTPIHPPALRLFCLLLYRQEIKHEAGANKQLLNK